MCSQEQDVLWRSLRRQPLEQRGHEERSDLVGREVSEYECLPFPCSVFVHVIMARNWASWEVGMVSSSAFGNRNFYS